MIQKVDLNVFRVRCQEFPPDTRIEHLPDFNEFGLTVIEQLSIVAGTE